MKNVFFVVLGIWVSLTVFVTQAYSGPTFTNSDLRGDFGYSVQGNFGLNLSSTSVETGIISADGNGNFTGSGKAVINGVVVVGTSYKCTYVVHPNGTVDVRCDRTVAGQTLKLDLYGVMDDSKKELRFISLPTTTRNLPPGSPSPFEVINAIGSARKQ